MNILPPLTISKTKCYLQLDRCTPVSKFLEATIRGAMGYALKKKLCLFKNRECTKCLVRETCGYSTFFEPAPPQNSALQHSMQQAARSWMFNATQFSDRVQLEISLIGNAQNFLESILTTIDEIGNIGLGKKQIQYKICAVQPSVNYNLSELSQQNASKATLSFVTPITLRSQGKFMREWDNHLFFATLLRRITNLSVIHKISVQDFNAKALLKFVDNIKTEAFLSTIAQDRTSTHQNRTIDYHGLIGDIQFSGLTPKLNQILQAGELLSVGKNTVFGYGKYRIIW